MSQVEGALRDNLCDRAFIFVLNQNEKKLFHVEYMRLHSTAIKIKIYCECE